MAKDWLRKEGMKRIEIEIVVMNYQLRFGKKWLLNRTRTNAF
jgi:hypothetical protein